MIELTEKVLFGDVWERPNLSKRDRSLIVCATLIATYRPEQLVGHLQRALDNGVTKDEISEMITHRRFIPAGRRPCPRRISRVRCLKRTRDQQGVLK